MSDSYLASAATLAADVSGNGTDKRGVLPVIKNGKIIDMVKAWTAVTDQPFISFEYFPPRTEEGVAKLHGVIAEMVKQKPMFMDFTWGAGGSTSDLTLDLSKKSQEQHGVMANMHLTCTNQSKEVCDAGLAGAKEAGICNIVALRGDPPKGQDRWEVTEGGFACALDLVKYMRSNYGDYFSIQVRLVMTAQRNRPRGPASINCIGNSPTPRARRTANSPGPGGHASADWLAACRLRTPHQTRPHQTGRLEVDTRPLVRRSPDRRTARTLSPLLRRLRATRRATRIGSQRCLSWAAQ